MSPTAICGCGPIVAVDVRPRRLELALELGATHAINANDVDPVLAIRELTGGGAEASLETSGVPEVFIPKLIEFWRAGRLPIERLVRAYDFDQINQAADDALAGDVVKPVLRMA